MGPESDRGASARWWSRALRTALAVGVAIGGTYLAVVLAAIGHCGAFGGLCPAPPQPLWEDDVFGSVAVVMWITTVVAGFVIRPTRRGAAVAATLGVVIGLAVGLPAADWAAG
jgi:hypothetical protein